MISRAMIKRMTAVLALLLALIVPAEAGSYAAIVTTGSLPVFGDAQGRQYLGSLPATTVVQVQAVEGDVAYISLNGNFGFAPASGMIALSSLAKPVKFNTSSRVYQIPNLSGRWMAVPSGMQVNLLAVNGPWAMVENGGIVAYTNKDHLTEIAQTAPVVPSAPAEPSQPTVNQPAADGIVYETFPAKAAIHGVPVFVAASTSSRCLGFMTEGTQVTVNAYNSGWAYIELNGCYGFAQIGHLTRVTAEPEPETPAAGGSTVEALQNAGYSTEQIIYLFLTQEMGLNTAVACGILANIEKECSFRVTAASSDGGYGIVQWTGVRNTRLKNWCKDNDYDYTTLEAQLWFLKYELEVHHYKTLNYLKTIENTEAGAYEAAYYFCYHYEVPANRSTRSVERAKLSRDKYWVRYAAV